MILHNFIDLNSRGSLIIGSIIRIKLVNRALVMSIIIFCYNRQPIQFLLHMRTNDVIQLAKYNNRMINNLKTTNTVRNFKH